MSPLKGPNIPLFRPGGMMERRWKPSRSPPEAARCLCWPGISDPPTLKNSDMQAGSFLFVWIKPRDGVEECRGCRGVLDSDWRSVAATARNHRPDKRQMSPLGSRCTALSGLYSELTLTQYDAAARRIETSCPPVLGKLCAGSVPPTLMMTTMTWFQCCQQPHAYLDFHRRYRRT